MYIRPIDGWKKDRLHHLGDFGTGNRKAARKMAASCTVIRSSPETSNSKSP